jgi:LysM repeat protein
MILPIPTNDGQVIEYTAVLPPNSVPRIYYVNGIQTDGEGHAKTAYALSVLTEHVVEGVFNATAGKGAGIIVDLLQCGADWIDVFLSKLAEIGNIGLSAAIGAAVNFARDKQGLPAQDPVSVANAIREKIPQSMRVLFIERCLGTYNRATASLFQQLRTHLGERQVIIAHSQGNLITADALWSMVIAFGEMSLSDMQVYSLASPAPAWPLGIRYRRKVYGHTNDAVTLCDPHNWTFITGRIADGAFGRTAGDWRQYGTSALPGLDGHDINRNIALNFTNTIRRDLGLPPLTDVKPAAPLSPPAAGPQTYTVRPGDSLWRIAQSFYGNGSAWPKIYNANRDTIGSNPNLIRAGQSLDIP